MQTLANQQYLVGITLSAVRTGAAHVELRCGRTGNETVEGWVRNSTLTAIKVTP